MAQVHSALKGKVFYPGDPVYVNQQNGTVDGYWSALESDIRPACRLGPTRAKDVAEAVSILARGRCSFAVRGGGHTPWATAANIPDGVTIDLIGLKQINTTGQVTSVGGGARWDDVYRTLQPLGVTVVGGRNSPVGVGGLITGGGNSYIGPLYGWACDNVINFEVVLGSGKMVNANAQENQDLFRALKGGSNNFGVVTRFDLRTFRLDKIWGGSVSYPTSTVRQQFQALKEFTTASGNGVDPNVSVMTVNVWVGGEHVGTANSYFNAEPVESPAILKPFTDIQPVLSTTMRVDEYLNLTREANAILPNGRRALFATGTFGNSAELCMKIFDIVDSALRSTKNFTAGTGSGGGVNIQPISRDMLRRSNSLGENSLGLGPEDGDLIAYQLTLIWDSPDNDAAFIALQESVVEQCTTAAREAGLDHPWIDLTHAYATQDPLSSYGADNLARLRSTAKKYDPDGVFQKLVPGGFKLGI
ncbi:MAG: hypothetical protein M1823_002492 [Watsoniomyces obsoletus]|nr:MAG: hypothetical protein M1823_002492 [Watsoniomyces obsoletus]